MKTACTWPWKLASSQECVTAHMPNGLVPKMDGSYRGRAWYGQAAHSLQVRLGQGVPVAHRRPAVIAGSEGHPLQILVSVGAFTGKP